MTFDLTALPADLLTLPIGPVLEPMVPTPVGEIRFGTSASNNMTIAGNEVGLVGMDGDDTLNGGARDDFLIGDYFDVAVLSGGSPPFDATVIGNDKIFGGDGDDFLDGGQGNDDLFGGNGDDYFAMYEPSLGFDTFHGGAGDDRIDFYDGVHLGNSNVSLTGLNLAKSASIETLSSGLEIRGTSGDNVFDLTGIDLIDFYDAASDDGFDLLGGNDRYEGGSANDTVFGNTGLDTLIGGNGWDSLNGGLGKDVLTGGGSSDAFIFGTALGPSNVDRITDFEAQDAIWLQKSQGGPFAALATNGLSEAQFKVIGTGGGAVDGSDRILYSQSSGKIYYDADGSGAGAKVLFATVTAGTVLTAADFLVI